MFLTRGLILLCLAGFALQAPQLGTGLSRARDYVQQYERTLGMMIARDYSNFQQFGVTVETDLRR